MQQQPEETQRKLLLIAKPHTTEEKSQTYGLKASSIVPWFGQQMASHTQQSPAFDSTQQTSHRAATDSKCQQKPSRADGNTKSQLPSSGVEQP